MKIIVTMATLFLTLVAFASQSIDLTEDQQTMYLNQIQANLITRQAFNLVISETKNKNCSSHMQGIRESSSSRKKLNKISFIVICNDVFMGEADEYAIILDFELDASGNLTGKVTESTAG